MPDTKLKNGQRSAAAGGGTALVEAPTAPSTRFGGAKVAPPTSTNAPTLAPPMQGGAARTAIGGAAAARVAAAAWLNSQTINALWTINEDKNSWLGVAGIGWMKLANNSDSAIVALTILGAHAKDGQRLVNLRQEDDGMIHEMYVW